MLETIVPYWNDKSKYLNDIIWNPQVYENSLVQNKTLYFTEEYHPTLSNEKINAEQSKMEELIITRKIRFYPTANQKKYLNKCLSAHRHFYNKTIEQINNQYDKRKQEFESCSTCIFCSSFKEQNSYTCEEHKNKPLPWKLNVNFGDLRKVVVKNNGELSENEKWQEEIPHDTRQAAVKNAVSAYKTCMANKVRGNIKHFRLGYMSRKKSTHIFWVDHRAIKIKEKNNKVEVSLFKTKLKKDSQLFIRNKYRKQIPLNNDSAVKVLYDRGSWYLVFSITDNTVYKCDNSHSIALDPGVRTFQTGYSPNGSVYKFGEYQLNQMKCNHTRVDTLKSVSTSSGYKKRFHIKKRLSKLEFRLRGIIHNLHNQIGSMLAKKYRYVLLPEFGTSGMQQENTIGSTTKRRMNGLAHYQFQMKMQHFCKKYGSNLKIVNESYTSKTCGNCGLLKENLGSACHFDCSNCQYSLDRDVHGARNIWIKTYSC